MYYTKNVDGNMLMVNQGNCHRWFICTTCSSSRPCHPALSLTGRTSQLPARSRPSCSWLPISKYGWKIQTTHLACSRTPCKFAVPSIKTDRQKTPATPQIQKLQWKWSKRCTWIIFIIPIYCDASKKTVTQVSLEKSYQTYPVLFHISGKANKMYQFIKSLPW